MKKYFSYDSECGFELHNTVEDALRVAQGNINYYRSEASEGWPECVDSVCWGEIKQHAIEVDTTAEFGVESCDYLLLDTE